MTLQAIFADRAFSPDKEILNPVVLVEGGRIVGMGNRDEIAVPAEAQRLDAQGLTIVPGFVDLHLHGAGGHDIMMEAGCEALAAITRSVAKRGTTSFVATTVTAGAADTCRAASGIADWIESQNSKPRLVPQADVLGIHFEGPFISPARRGVHPLEHLAPPSLETLRRFIEASRGTARILTLAPELPGALPLIDAACKSGIVVSLGHTDATYLEAVEAIAHGAQHAAHVFNAMRPFAHRETGVVGAVLTSPAVTAELIADGIHVDAAAIRVLLAAKGARGVVLVSDGTAATGMPDGSYRLGTLEITVTHGVPRDVEGKLAGSTLTLDQALRNMVALGVAMTDALAMLTTNPARVLGLEKKKGALIPGADADLVFFDPQLEIRGVMTLGHGWPVNAKGTMP
jgi:N-acetylglucosamine-6-phosphate deacetylase